MRVRHALALVLALVAVSVVGCGPPAPETGYVRDRDHQAAWDEHSTTQVCASWDPKGGCSVWVPFEQVDHHPEQWRLLLEECDAGKDGKVECRRGWRSVSADAYEQHPVGSHYPDPR